MDGVNAAVTVFAILILIGLIGFQRDIARKNAARRAYRLKQRYAFNYRVGRTPPN